jgi:hypothetical protein
VSTTTWLPNLVGGVSIWKLARDLNEPKFMDGRLLVPETEGSESLPTSVTWDVARLMPFAEAREKHGPDVEKATQEFAAALSRVADEFRKESSGYNQYKEAFTVPSIEADDGGHYFYDPAEKKLFAVNWGATPRSLSGYQEFVFGWDRFGKAMAGAATLAAAKAAASGKTAPADGDKKPEDDKKDEKKKDEEKKRPFWIWLLLVALFIGILLLILYLLKACEAQQTSPLSDASADALVDGEAGALTDAASDAEAGGEAGAEAGTDGGDAGDAGDASADAGKDGGDAGADAGKDGGKDAGATADDDDDDDEDLDDDGSGGGGGGSGGGGGGGGGGKKVTAGPAGGAKGGPHRVHVHPQAVEWRITSGWGKVSRTVQKGHRFDVYLGKGNTYDGVRVEYKDPKGAWHGF